MSVKHNFDIESKQNLKILDLTEDCITYESKEKCEFLLKAVKYYNGIDTMITVRRGINYREKIITQYLTGEWYNIPNSLSEIYRDGFKTLFVDPFIKGMIQQAFPQRHSPQPFKLVDPDFVIEYYRFKML